MIITYNIIWNSINFLLPFINVYTYDIWSNIVYDAAHLRKHRVKKLLSIARLFRTDQSLQRLLTHLTFDPKWHQISMPNGSSEIWQSANSIENLLRYQTEKDSKRFLLAHFLLRSPIVKS